MTLAERDRLIEQCKQLRELTFQLSDMLLKGKEAVMKGHSSPGADAAKKVANEMRNLSLSVSNSLSNEQTL